MNNIFQPATKWDKLWIDMAQRISEESKDRSTQVGCVLVTPDNTLISSGWNGFPRLINDDIDCRHERPEKYDWTVHAERNAIYSHGRSGGPSLMGSVAYLNFEPTPCSGCMAALIQVGVSTIAGPNISFTGVGTGIHYDLEDITPQMFKEANIIRRVVDYDPRR